MAGQKFTVPCIGDMVAFDPLTAAFDIGGKLLDHFFPDPSKRAEAQLELLKLQQSGDLAVMAQQSDINKIEAANANLFIAGWRPFCGWIGGAGLAYQFIVAPLGTWIAALSGHPVPLPLLDTGTLTTLLFTLLGVGGMRTVEKLSNAQGNH